MSTRKTIRVIWLEDSELFTKNVIHQLQEVSDWVRENVEIDVVKTSDELLQKIKKNKYLYTLAVLDNYLGDEEVAKTTSEAIDKLDIYYTIASADNVKLGLKYIKRKYFVGFEIKSDAQIMAQSLRITIEKINAIKDKEDKNRICCVKYTAIGILVAMKKITFENREQEFTNIAKEHYETQFHGVEKTDIASKNLKEEIFANHVISSAKTLIC